MDTKEPLDNTSEVCAEFGCRYINQEEPYFGGAFRTGIKYASFDKFLILDSDGSHNPKYIPNIYKMFIEQKKDIVIGSRYCEGGHTEDAKSSQIMSAILNFAFRAALGFKVRDMSTDYRMYKTEDLKNVELSCLNYDVLEEVLLKIKLNRPDKKLNVGETPITFSKRIFGDSKRKLIPFIIDYGKTLVKLIFMRFPTLKNFMLYAFLGGFAFFIDYFIFIALSKSLFSEKPEFANVISSFIGFLFTFTTNTFLNFKKRNKIAFRFVSYGLICLFGVFLTTLGIHLLKNTIDLKLLKFVLLVVVSCIQFVLNKMITYRW
nr:glycosyltransferase [Treponema sp.]